MADQEGVPRRNREAFDADCGRPDYKPERSDLGSEGVDGSGAAEPGGSNRRWN